MLGDNKSVLLLSTHRELFDVLFNPPSPGSMAPVKTPPAGPITTRRGGP